MGVPVGQCPRLSRDGSIRGSSSNSTDGERPNEDEHGNDETERVEVQILKCLACATSLSTSSGSTIHPPPRSELVFPFGTPPPALSEDIPEDLREAFKEAWKLKPHSDRATAMARRALQSATLRRAGYEDNDLYNEIEKAAAKPPPAPAQNEAALRPTGGSLGRTPSPQLPRPRARRVTTRRCWRSSQGRLTPSSRPYSTPSRKSSFSQHGTSGSLMPSTRELDAAGSKKLDVLSD